MHELPVCPVCGVTRWRELGHRTYRASEASSQSDYVRKRYEVLFSDWFPGQDRVRITSLLCTCCGLITYRPRPGSEDLDAKYRRLQQLENPSRRSVTEVDRARAAEVCGHAVRIAGRPVVRDQAVLDFGGGDGRLMLPYVKAGCRCDLVDYVGEPQPGVTRRASALAELPDTTRYDWIIACHVVEHLARPLETVRELASRLSPCGVLCVEVPLEIWGRPPLLAEPVTHINFFTRSSLRCLLEMAGLEVIDCRLASSLHPTGRRLPAIRAVATRAHAHFTPQPPGTWEADRFLSANPLVQWRCRLLLPRVLLGQVGRLCGVCRGSLV